MEFSFGSKPTLVGRAFVKWAGIGARILCVAGDELAKIVDEHSTDWRPR